MRQTDGVIFEAIYYDVIRTSYTVIHMSYAHHTHVIHRWAPMKQMLLYLPLKTKYGSQRKFKWKVDNDK